MFAISLELSFQRGEQQRLLDAVGQVAADGFGPVHGVLPGGVVVVARQQDGVMSVGAAGADDRADVGFAVGEGWKGEGGAGGYCGGCGGFGGFGDVHGSSIG